MDKEVVNLLEGVLPDHSWNLLNAALMATACEV